MEPFKVAFKLATPMVVDSEYPIHLDALLEYAAVQELELLNETDCWAKASVHLAENGILARTEGADWVWKASRLFATAASSIMFTNQIRKTDPNEYFRELVTPDNPNGVMVTGFMKDRSPRKVNLDTYKIQTDSGQQRSYQWLAATRWMHEVVGYGIGDIDQIDSYLRDRIKFLGKIGRNGCGRIATWTVSPHDDPDSWRLRVLPPSAPGKEGVRYAPVQACIRAPYWRKTDRVNAMEPIL